MRREGRLPHPPIPHPPIPHSSYFLLKAEGKPQWDTERGESYGPWRGRAPAWIQRGVNATGLGAGGRLPGFLPALAAQHAPVKGLGVRPRFCDALCTAVGDFWFGSGLHKRATGPFGPQQKEAIEGSEERKEMTSNMYWRM